MAAGPRAGPYPTTGGRHDAAPMPLRSLAAAANLAREAPNSGPFGYFRTAGSPAASEVFVVKVIASDVRKGNVLEHEDGQLYVVLSHETFRPGKGTPTTTIIMRRITDGVKTDRGAQDHGRSREGLRRADQAQLSL
ncbi:MAG: hypothetical protein R3C30_02120 [Hyphomonadaceae bacterium]